MQIGTAPEIKCEKPDGDWLHSNKVMGGICVHRYAIDKSLNWSIESARSPRRMVVRSARRLLKVSAPGLFLKLN